MRIFLDFSPAQTGVHRARLSYAFRLFCAIYGHAPVLDIERAEGAEVWIKYAPGGAPGQRKPVLELSDLYQPRPPHEPAPPPSWFEREGESTVLHYSPLPGREPDWLAEIFEWVSCADEYSVAERNSWGQIPFRASYVGRHGLDRRKPYAAVAMRLLQNALCRLLRRGVDPPPCPAESVRHFIVQTHDVDYLHVGRLKAAYRLAKNAAISCLLARRPGLAMKQVIMALRTAIGGEDPLDPIPALAHLEMHLDVSASYYFLVRQLHRRDANYTIDQPGVKELMRLLRALGMEVGVHGSYTCLDKPDGLAEEYDCVRRLGFRPLGGRQHWLRYTLDRLIPALELAGAAYDTSLGWADGIGFRAGACFAFPPYSFAEERPAAFLELPLAVMDVSLRDGVGREADWSGEAEKVLSASRRYGWGGISLLWHPAAFGGGWLSPEAENIFWRLLENRSGGKDTWLSAAAFLQSVRQRYVEVGLLEPERAPAAMNEQFQVVAGRRGAATFSTANPPRRTPSHHPLVPSSDEEGSPSPDGRMVDADARVWRN